MTKKTSKVENFQESEEKNLKQRLHELQLEYCQDEKPNVFVKTISSDNQKFAVAFAESDCDYAHMIVLKEL